MAKKSVWKDDNWLLLLQLFLKRPAGIKPLYSRPMVDLAMELHIPPQALLKRMEQIAQLQTPRIERFWKTYSKSPQRLARAVRLLRSMNGFGQAEDFYDGVEVQETFEKDFRPVVFAPGTQLPDAAYRRLTPAMLIILLDLYFQLTPSTMVVETPEVQQTGRLLKIGAELVVQVLETYQHCDPYLGSRDFILTPLLLPCQQVWQRYGNGEPQQLEAFAKELKEYFK